MILTLPFKKMTQDDITQIFHSGHEAWDIVENSTPIGKLYGTPLCAPENCLVLGITNEGPLHDSNKLASGYGLRMKGLETGMEYLYWHTLPILPVWGGQNVSRGQIVAFMGNSGRVYQGGNPVPLEDRLTNPQPGTHLHLEVYKNNVKIDPLPLFNWNWQPTWGYLDFITAFSVVLSKISQKIT